MTDLSSAPRQRYSGTGLQVALLQLAEMLAEVRNLSEREQVAFADIAEIAIVKSLGPALVVGEAEVVLAKATA